jgi:hypothetical protein
MNDFLKGISTVLDIAGQKFDYYKDDTEAIRSDWEAVGKDIKKVI